VKAASAGDLDMVRKLISEGHSVNQKHPLTQWTPLMAASYQGHQEIAQTLIDKGADVNAKDKKGGTALMKAITTTSSDPDVMKKKAEIARLLLKSGADPYLANNVGEITWQMPFNSGHEVFIDVFDEQGVKGVRETRFMNAIEFHDQEKAKKIFSRKPDLTFRNEDDYDALGVAIISNNYPAVRLILLLENPDVNVRYTKEEWTPLMLAVKFGQLQTVSDLLKAGADPALKNNAGQTASSIALETNQLEILKALRKAAGRRH